MSIFVTRRRELLMWAVMSLICGLTGPFGSYVYLDWNIRFLYWGVLMGAAMVFGAAIELINANFFVNVKFCHVYYF